MRILSLSHSLKTHQIQHVTGRLKNSFNEECWLEIDLHWFQGASPKARAEELFARLLPLWSRSGKPRAGLLICAGWLLDSVLYFSGDLDEEIPTCTGKKYEAWTFRRLKELVEEIRLSAEAGGIADFHVGLSFIGSVDASHASGPNIDLRRGRTNRASDKYLYDIKGKWFFEHPEVHDPAVDHPYSFAAKVQVPVDEAPLFESPPTLAQYLGLKLGKMTRAVGMDAGCYRDGAFFNTYARANANGLYCEPDRANEWTEAIIEFLAATKRENPAFIHLGYSSAVSNVSTWRSFGFDLERIAKSGFLDIWVTQSWASAFQDFWRAESAGYTFMLSMVLYDLVALQNTPTRHVFVIETFDAWEPFESIDDFPEKITWLIWALSHASVRTPSGQCSRTNGIFISWMNKADRLIDQGIVSLLEGTLDSVSRDLERNPVPFGPCIVYDRNSMEELIRSPDEYCRGEGFDTWNSMLIKFGLPILSITRSEWIDSDSCCECWIVPPSFAMKEPSVRALIHRSRQGDGLILVGLAEKAHALFKAAFDIDAEPVVNSEDCAVPAAIASPVDSFVRSKALVLNQKAASLVPNKQWIPIIACMDRAIFAKHQHENVCIWETPEYGTPREAEFTHETFYSMQSFWSVAAGIAHFLPKPGIRWANQRFSRPCVFLGWRYPDDSAAILLGNIESGLTGDSMFPSHGKLMTEGETEIIPHDRSGNSVRVAPGENEFAVTIGAHQFAILSLLKIDQTVKRREDDPSVHSRMNMQPC